MYMQGFHFWKTTSSFEHPTLLGKHLCHNRFRFKDPHLTMSSSHSGMTSHISAQYKRKRPIDSLDPEDVEPPVKMLKTDPGPEGGLQEEGMSLAEHVTPLVDVEELKTHAKHRNSKYCNCIIVGRKKLTCSFKSLHLVCPSVNGLV